MNLEELAEHISNANKALVNAKKIYPDGNQVNLLNTLKEETLKKAEELKTAFEVACKSDNGDYAVAKIATATSDFMSAFSDLTSDSTKLLSDKKDEIDGILKSFEILMKDLQRRKKFKEALQIGVKEVVLEIATAITAGAMVADSNSHSKKANHMRTLRDTIIQIGNSTLTESTLNQIEDKFTDLFHNRIHIRNESKVLEKIFQNLKGLLAATLEKIKGTLDADEQWAVVETLCVTLKAEKTRLEACKTEIEKIENQTDDSLEAGLVTKLNEINGAVGGEVEKVFGSLSSAFSVFKEIFKVGDWLVRYPNEIEDSEWPLKLKHEPGKNESDWVDKSIQVPVASIGWLSLNVGASIKVSAEYEYKLNLEVVKPEVNNSKFGSFTAELTGKITTKGSILIALHVMEIVSVELSAQLEAELNLAELKAELEYHHNEQKRKFELKGTAEIEFKIEGALVFTLTLTPVIRTIIRTISGKDPAISWKLVKKDLFDVQFSHQWAGGIEFENGNGKFDFENLKKILKSASTYRVSDSAINDISSSVETNVGSRQAWKKLVKGPMPTEETINGLKRQIEASYA